MVFMECPTNRIHEVLIEKGIKQTRLAEKLCKSLISMLQSLIAKSRIAISYSRDLAGSSKEND